MTVITVAALAVLLLIGAAGLALAGAAQAAHRARTAADLGALAAAAAVLEGVADPCAEGSRIVERNGARVRSCVVGLGGDVTIRASMPVRLQLPGLASEAVATARAGPPEAR
jgi:secretion/DNA translocation related TadE-like protein